MKSDYASPEKISVSLVLMILLLLFSMGVLLAPYFRDFIGDDYIQLWRIRDLLIAPESAYKIFSPYWTDWYYRPLQNLWFLLNRLIFGLLPPGYYFLQVYCHLIAISLLFQIARILGLGRWIAFGVAALFAINGQHQLTIGWISSIGNVLGITFSLAAFAAYLGYLQKPDRGRYLSLTVLCTIMAMLAHELGIVVPFLLVGLRLLWPISRRISRAEIISVIIIAVLTVLYASIQIIRPNANLVVDDDYFSSLPAAYTPAQIGQFASAVLYRWFLFSITADPLSDIGTILPTTITSWLIIFVILALTSVVFIRGNLATRIGLLWTGLQLGFILTALWNYRPELFDSRHLYGAWAGLCILFGGLLYSLREINRVRYWISRQRIIYLGGSTAMLSLFLIFQLMILRSEQKALLGHARLVERSEQQLKEILPEPDSHNRLFANRFILTPPYLPPVASVWFDMPNLTGGSLDALKNKQIVNYQDYVFDYENGVLYNLMPELQQSKRTVFLWRESPVSANLLYEKSKRLLYSEEIELDKVLEGFGENRFGIALQPAEVGWTSIRYAANIPIESRLAFGLFPRSKQAYRVRVIGDEGKSRILYSLEATTDAAEWLDIDLPLADYEGQDVDIYFEYRPGFPLEAQGFWANPRFIID